MFLSWSRDSKGVVMKYSAHDYSNTVTTYCASDYMTTTLLVVEWQDEGQDNGAQPVD